MKKTFPKFTLAFLLCCHTALSHAADAPIDTDAKMEQKLNDHFKFWNQEKIKRSDYSIILKNLDIVRRKVGEDFNVYPTRKIEVIVTDAATFREYSGESKHVAGLFDGKIHLPIPTGRSPKEFQSILWHEYTHAIVYDRTHGRCPIWLNEGLAEFEEATIVPENRAALKQILDKKGRLPFKTLEELESVFYARGSAQPQMVYMAYQQSHAIANYLFQRYRKGGILQLLDNLRTAKTMDEAIQKTFGVSSPTIIEKASLLTQKL